MKTHELIENKVLKFTPKAGIRRPRLTLDEIPVSKKTGELYIRFEAKEIKHRESWVWQLVGIREDGGEEFLGSYIATTAKELAKFYNEALQALQRPKASVASFTAAKWKKRFKDYLPQ